MAARESPSPELILSGSKHLLYELLMLSNTAAVLENHRWEQGWERWTLYMASMESFTVHLRNLTDFFDPPPDYGTSGLRRWDVFAVDYGADWQPQVDFGDVRKWISREVLHLSYLRPEQARQWPVGEYVHIVGECMGRFLDGQDRLHPHILGELRGVLRGQRYATAHIPDEPLVIANPRTLSGFVDGLSTPTSAVLLGPVA